MKLFLCLACLTTVTSIYYPPEVKMARLTAVTTSIAQRMHQKLHVLDINSVSSPLSVHMIVTNLELGAYAETWDEINTGMELGRFTGGILKPHEAYCNVSEQYRTANNTLEGTVFVANYISVNSRAPILQKFLNNTRMYYPTLVSSHNGTDPLTTEQKINDYIKNKTGGHIKDIVKPGSLSNGAEIILANALYVSAAWQKPFKPQDTAKHTFSPTTGPSFQIDMLEDSYRQVRTKYNFYGADMVELPCTGNRYSMYFLVPQYNTPLADLEKSLTKGNISKELFEGLTVQFVKFRVPRIQMESTFELSSVLKNFSVVKAFEPGQANFRALSRTNGTFVTKHFHKAVIEVNENGTGPVPAAVSTPRSSFTSDLFYLDSPFIYFFRDNINKLILIQGQFYGK